MHPRCVCLYVPSRITTLLCVCPLQAVVEASVWLLRAILALSSLSLPPTHALVTHMLPDLTQLSVMHTSRNAVPGPLPRHIVESQKVTLPQECPHRFHITFLHSQRSAARAMGILRMDKGASMPIDTFSGRRAQQFVETFSSMKSQQPSTLPAVWPQVCMDVLVNVSCSYDSLFV